MWINPITSISKHFVVVSNLVAALGEVDVVHVEVYVSLGLVEEIVYADTVVTSLLVKLG